MALSRLDKLKEMQRQKPDDVFLKFAIALEYASLKSAEVALMHFEQLMENQPEYLPTYYQAGKIYESVENPAKAIEVYKKGIEVATAAGDKKTLNELQEALMLLEDE